MVAWTTGGAINVAKKICTAAIILLLAGIYGLQDTRKVRNILLLWAKSSVLEFAASIGAERRRLYMPACTWAI